MVERHPFGNICCRNRNRSMILSWLCLWGTISIVFSVYVPDELLSSFAGIPLLSTSISDSKLMEVSFGSDIYPLVVFVTNLKADAWSKTALLSEESVYSFLLSDFAAGNSHYLFIPADDLTDMTILAASFQSAANVIVTEGIEIATFDTRKMSRLLFANTTIHHMRLAGGYSGLLGPLDQWKTSIDQISFTTTLSSSSTPSQFAVNITRLDCAWPYCFGPYSGDGGYLIDGGDFCAPYDPQHTNATFPHNIHLNESYVLITANTCNYEIAAQHVDDLGKGVLGSVIIMREDEPTLLEINSDGAVQLNHGTAVTSVSYQDGMALKNKLHILQQTNNNGKVSFFSQVISGYFIVIDGKKRIQEIGSHGEASLMLASWAMQYENYRCEVFARLAKPAYIIPIISEKVSYWFPTTTAKDAVIIPRKEMEQFGTMEIDTEITCPGLYDSDCSRWDHTVTIRVLCADDQLGLRRREVSESGITGDGVTAGGNPFTGDGKALTGVGKRAGKRGFAADSRGLGGGGEVGGEAIEIARYVTPFSRRSGRWITPATQFIPLLLSLPTTSTTTSSSSSSSKSCESFLFQSYSEGSHWIVTSNLRFTDWGIPPPKKYTPLYAFSEYFRPSTYNVNRTLHLTIPKHNQLPPVRVELEALITTHGSDEYGCCEFLPTKHVFTINGEEFLWSFTEAGTEWGCADRAGEGSEPNEYGTWWYGRGNWCDGMDVKPLVVDVTTAVLRGQETVEVSYQAYMMDVVHNGMTINWIPPQSDQASGYVILSSNLVYYYGTTGTNRPVLINDDGYDDHTYAYGNGNDDDGKQGDDDGSSILSDDDDGTASTPNDTQSDRSPHKHHKNHHNHTTTNSSKLSSSFSQTTIGLIPWSLWSNPQVLYWLIADGILHLLLLFLFCYYRVWKDCCSMREFGPRGMGIRLGLISPTPQYTYVLEQSTHNARASPDSPLHALSETHTNSSDAVEIIFQADQSGRRGERSEEERERNSNRDHNNHHINPMHAVVASSSLTATMQVESVPATLRQVNIQTSMEGDHV